MHRKISKALCTCYISTFNEKATALEMGFISVKKLLYDTVRNLAPWTDLQVSYRLKQWFSTFFVLRPIAATLFNPTTPM